MEQVTYRDLPALISELSDAWIYQKAWDEEFANQNSDIANVVYRKQVKEWEDGRRSGWGMVFNWIGCYQHHPSTRTEDILKTMAPGMYHPFGDLPSRIKTALDEVKMTQTDITADTFKVLHISVYSLRDAGAKCVTLPQSTFNRIENIKHRIDEYLTIDRLLKTDREALISHLGRSDVPKLRGAYSTFSL